jgi:MoaA/NifB/PqqE/SkfB family radical SAM enzyme
MVFVDKFRGYRVHLDTVLEAVKLAKQSVRNNINTFLTKLTSQQELAIWQPA